MMRLRSNMKLKFDKNELILKISQNRQTHQATYEAAVLEHRRRLIEQLKEMLNRVSVTNREITHKDLTIDLPIPEQHLDEYDRVLVMLGMTTQPEIELTQEDFDCLVLDNWEWQASFASNTGRYA